MSSNKEVQPSEVSLKYMAWNVKEISESVKQMNESIKRMADMLSDFMSNKPHYNPQERPRSESQQKLPF